MKNSFPNRDFSCNDYSAFLQAARQCKVVIFGAGRIGTYAKQTFCAGLDVAYYVDNDHNNWYKQQDGLIVYPPDALLEENGELIVLISINAPFTVMEQLEYMGIYRYYASQMFFDYHAQNNPDYLRITL